MDEKGRMKRKNRTKPVEATSRVTKVTDCYLKTCFSCFLEHRALCFALLSALSFVTVDVLVYKAGQHLSAVEVPFWNSAVVSSLSALVILGFRPEQPSTVSEVLYVIVGGTLCGVGAILILLAIIFDNPGDAISLYYTVPVFSTLMAFALFNEKPRLLHTFLALLAVLGVSLVSGPTFCVTPSLNKTRTLFGLGMALSSAVVSSAGFVVVRRLSEIHATNPFFITATSGVAGLTASATLWAYFQSFTIPTTTVIALTLFSNGFFSFGSYVLIFLALRYENASYVTIAMTSEVLLSFLAQYVFFKTEPSLYSLAGAVLITTTCVGLAFDNNQQKEENEQGAPILSKG